MRDSGVGEEERRVLLAVQIVWVVHAGECTVAGVACLSLVYGLSSAWYGVQECTCPYNTATTTRKEADGCPR